MNTYQELLHRRLIELLKLQEKNMKPFVFTPPVYDKIYFDAMRILNDDLDQIDDAIDDEIERKDAERRYGN